MGYNSIHVNTDALQDDLKDLVFTSEGLSAKIARLIDEHIEELRKEDIEGLELDVCCSGDGSIFACHPLASPDAPFHSVSMSFNEFFERLDPSACDSRESRLRIAAQFEEAAKLFRDEG